MATSPPPPQPPPPKKKKPSPAPIIPWSHDETEQLIEAYQEKWYSLRRGPLKSAHWEEVAVTVAARCGHHDADQSPSSSSAAAAAANSRPAKSALQCRHKMEKLRRRFRSESRRTAPAWPFFVPMDRMLRGPFPISARPMDDPAAAATISDDDDRDRDRERGRGRNGSLGAKSRSLDCILRRPEAASSLAAPAKRPRRGGGECSERGGVAAELAEEIRGFAERMAAVERAKMEAAREAERFRMEMEGRRIEMILRSQNRIVDAIARVFGSPNRHIKEEA